MEQGIFCRKQRKLPRELRKISLIWQKWQLIVSGLDVIEHGSQFDSSSLEKVVLFYVVFLVVDRGSAALAFAMERREKLALLPWLAL